MAWESFEYPPNWEQDEDFMCVHFGHKSYDPTLWESQKQFWSDCIRSYANQLSKSNISGQNKLTFNTSDISSAYTRKNQMTPLCVIDIVEHMIKDIREMMTCEEYLKEIEALEHNGFISETSPSFSISKHLSSFASSLVGYVMTPSDETNETHFINSETLLVHTPTLDELCEAIEDLSLNAFHIEQSHDETSVGNSDRVKSSSVSITPSPATTKKSMSRLLSGSRRRNASSRKSNNTMRHWVNSFTNLNELMEMGTVPLEDGILVSELVFDKMCAERFGLTLDDIYLLKRHLMRRRSMVELIPDEKSDDTILKFISVPQTTGPIEITSQDKIRSKIISVRMTVGQLKYQKRESERKLHQVNQEIIGLLKGKNSKQKIAVMKRNKSVIARRKYLVNNCEKISNSIYNLEQALLTLDDTDTNSMIFASMENVSKILQSVSKSQPTRVDVENMIGRIEDSIDEVNDINDLLANEMSIGMDMSEVEDEYEAMQAQQVDEILPDVPCHDVSVNDVEMEQDESRDVHMEESGREKMVLIH